MTEALREHVLVHPAPAPLEVARGIGHAGHRWCALDASVESDLSPDGVEWIGAVVVADRDLEGALGVCAGLDSAGISPVLLLVDAAVVADLPANAPGVSDFCITPFHPSEFDARLRRLIARPGAELDLPSVVRYRELVLNVETYQAAIAGRPLDLTYICLLYTSPSPRDATLSRMPSSA